MIRTFAFLMLFMTPVMASEPVMTDRHGPGTQWYHPTVFGKKKKKIPQTIDRVGMAIVKAQSGATAVVARSVASKFQALIHKLEEGGTQIKFMGGLRRTRIAGTRTWSQHASGKAIDICQHARNVVSCKLPPNATQIAASLGLLHGAVWNNPDTGHFEVASSRRKRQPHPFLATLN